MFAIATVGCGSTAPPVADSTAETDTSAAVESVEPSAQEETNATSSDSKPDLKAIFGSTQDGWLPTLLSDAQLVHTMTPAEVSAIYPGADELSGEDGDEFRFSEAKEPKINGIQGYKFSFQNNTLYSVTVIFDPKFNGDEFFKELTDVTVEKYGDVEPQQIEDRHLIWVGPGFASATLSEAFSEFEGYEFDVVLPD